MALFLALGKTSALVHSRGNRRKLDDCHGGISTFFESMLVPEATEQGSKGRKRARDTSHKEQGTQKMSLIPESNTSTNVDFNRKCKLSHDWLKNVEGLYEVHCPGMDASDDDSVGSSDDGISSDIVKGFE